MNSNNPWDIFNYLLKHGDKELVVSEKVYNQRLEICESCSYFDTKQHSCMECGCFIPSKAKSILESCPLNKWTADEKSWNDKFDNKVN